MPDGTGAKALNPHTPVWRSAVFLLYSNGENEIKIKGMKRGRGLGVCWGQGVAGMGRGALLAVVNILVDNISMVSGWPVCRSTGEVMSP